MAVKDNNVDDVKRILRAANSLGQTQVINICNKWLAQQNKWSLEYCSITIGHKRWDCQQGIVRRRELSKLQTVRWQLLVFALIKQMAIGITTNMYMYQMAIEDQNVNAISWFEENTQDHEQY